MNPQEIFINEAGRLRSGWRFLIFAGVYLIAVQVALRLFVALASFALGNYAEAFFNGAGGHIAQGFILLALAILIGWGCGRLLEDLPFRALGWSFAGGWLRDWLMGSLIGSLSLLLAVGIATASGRFRFSLSEGGVSLNVAETLIFSGLIFILLAAAEEAIFRGYPLQTMTRAHMAWLAIIITAVIFSSGHLNNPNVAPGFTFINTAIAGVWLAFAYLRTRNLWFPLGIHWAWNWTMSAVLGIPVSGITSIAPNPLLRASDLGPAWLTGGSYGVEGGAACTIALLLSTLFIWRTRLVSANEEMLRLTDKENPKRAEQPLSILGSTEEIE
ncbi:MAG TPA: type II CAAX endopeptidase family protein [Pyrinomonadaceae bacterium]|nr:type II CAAX endopeptidase family protein [Pyrinomonadaceae bacterium]